MRIRGKLTRLARRLAKGALALAFASSAALSGAPAPDSALVVAAFRDAIRVTFVFTLAIPRLVAESVDFVLESVRLPATILRQRSAPLLI